MTTSSQNNSAAAWSSVREDQRRLAIRTYLWRIHPLTATAFVLLSAVATKIDRNVLLLGVIHLVAIALLGSRSASPGSLVLIAIADLAAIATIALVVPQLWIGLLCASLAVVSIGWAISFRATAALVAIASLTMSYVGWRVGGPAWWVLVAAMTAEAALLSAVALWSGHTPSKSLVQLSRVLDSLHVIVWEANADGAVVAASVDAEALTGLPADGLIGVLLTSLVPGLTDDRWGELIRWTESGGYAPITHRLNGTGDRSRVARSLIRVTYDHRSETRIHGVALDITRSWATERQQRRAASIVEHMSDGLLVIRSQGDDFVMSANREALARLDGMGLDPGGLIGEAWPALLEGLADGDDLDRGNVDSSRSFELEWEGRSRLAPAYWVAELHIAVQLTDITNPKQAEAKAPHLARHDASRPVISSVASVAMSSPASSWKRGRPSTRKRYGDVSRWRPTNLSGCRAASQCRWVHRSVCIVPASTTPPGRPLTTLTGRCMSASDAGATDPPHGPRTYDGATK